MISTDELIMLVGQMCIGNKHEYKQEREREHEYEHKHDPNTITNILQFHMFESQSRILGPEIRLIQG